MSELDVKQTFAKKLKELREEKGLTQDGVAKALGFSRGSVSFYENADRMAGIDFIFKAANFFNCTTDYLVGLNEYKNQEEKTDISSKYESISTLINEYNYKDTSKILSIYKKIGDGYKFLYNNFYDRIAEEYIMVMSGMMESVLAACASYGLVDEVLESDYGCDCWHDPIGVEAMQEIANEINYYSKKRSYIACEALSTLIELVANSTIAKIREEWGEIEGDVALAEIRLTDKLETILNDLRDVNKT